MLRTAASGEARAGSRLGEEEGSVPTRFEASAEEGPVAGASKSVLKAGFECERSSSVTNFIRSAPSRRSTTGTLVSPELANHARKISCFVAFLPVRNQAWLDGVSRRLGSTPRLKHRRTQRIMTTLFTELVVRAAHQAHDKIDKSSQCKRRPEKCHQSD